MRAQIATIPHTIRENTANPVAVMMMYAMAVLNR